MEKNKVIAILFLCLNISFINAIKNNEKIITKEYNPLLFNDTMYNLYASFNDSTTSAIDFYFEKEFADIYSYPTIKVNNKNLQCSHKASKLTCILNQDDFPDDQYIGEIININGVKEKDFTLTIIKNLQLIIKQVKFDVYYCHYMKVGSTLNIEFENKEDAKQVSDFLSSNIYLALVTNHTINHRVNLTCSISTTHITSCETNNLPSKGGEYHLIIDNNIELGNGLSIFPYYSTEFTLGSFSVNQLDEYKTEDDIHLNYAEDTVRYIFIQYVYTLSEPTYVYEKSTGKQLKCQIGFEYDGSESCDIDHEIFKEDEKNPEMEKTYEVILLDTCGSYEYTIYIYVKKQYTNIVFQSVTSLDIEDKCSNLPKGSNFKIEATNLAYVTKTLTLSDIKLVHSEDSTKIVDMLCLIDLKIFNCTTIDSAPKNGAYFMKLEESITKGKYIITPFTSKNSYNYNANANEVDITKTLFEYTFDYTENPKLEIKITYENKIIEIPVVKEKINNARFTCYKDETDLFSMICTFTKDMFPPETTQTTYTDYYAEIMNLCGTSAHDIKISVIQTYYPEIVIDDIILPEEAKCYNSAIDNLRFSFSSKNLDVIENEVTTKDVYLLRKLYDMVFKIPTECVANSKEFKCTISIDNPGYDEGTYDVVIPEGARLSHYATIQKKTFSSAINIKNTNTKLDVLRLEDITYDYLNGDKKSFTLYYKWDVKALPEVYLNNSKTTNQYLTCNYNQYYKTQVDCVFDKTQAKPGENEQSEKYTIYINDQCKNIVGTISLSVSQSMNTITFSKENYSKYGKCNKYSSGFSFTLDFKVAKAVSPLDYIQITKAYLKSGSYNQINVECKSKDTDTLDCQTINQSLSYNGEYSLYIPEQKIDLFKVNEFSSNTKIFFTTKQYNRPSYKIHLFEANYRIMNEFEFPIEFQYNFGNDLPKVVIEYNSKELSCKVDTNNNKYLLCKGNKEIFPPNPSNPSEDKIYNILLYSVCEQKEEVDIRVVAYDRNPDDEPKSQENKKSENTEKDNTTGIIIGIIVGALVLIAAVIIGVVIYVKKAKNKKEEGDNLMNKIDNMGAVSNE